MPFAAPPSAIRHPPGATDLRTALVTTAIAVRPPAGHLRVVDAIGADEAAQPYLAARAKVIRVNPSGGPLGAYHAVVADARSLAPNDTDVILWDGEGSADPGWLVSRLGPGGIFVAPGPVAPRLRALGLRVELGGAPEIAVGFDRRQAEELPEALAHLDRTMCVDRARVLRALREEPWQGRVDLEPDEHRARAQGLALLGALREQLAAGEPDVRTLPWPTAAVSRHERSGCDVLAIMPHPDDETIYCGGTLCGLARAGRQVHLVVATDGAGGRGGPGLGSRRAAELIQACEILGITSARCLAWTDTGKYRDVERAVPATAGDALASWTLERSLGDLVASIRQHRPRTMLSLGPEVDPNLSLHGHHLAVGILVAVAFHLAALPDFRPELGPAWAATEHRVMASAWVASGPQTAIAPIDADTKLRALRCHRTQEYSTRRLVGRLESGALSETTERTRRVQARGRDSWNLISPADTDSPFVTAPPEGWAARAKAVTQQPRDRAALVEQLAKQAAKLPSDDARAHSLERLNSPDAVVVVAGQQVGWLGGPAYTLVKALAAVELARRISAQGIPTVPVFWMASADHDLDEVATAPTLAGSSVRLDLENRGRPVGETELPQNVDDARAQWLALLPVAVRGRAGSLSESYRAGQTFTGAFARTLAQLTTGTGLLFFDPSQPAAARWARPVFERELLGEVPARQLLRSSPRPHVVPVNRDVTQVFYVDDEGQRRRLARTGTGVSWGEGSLDRNALRLALSSSPQRFSPAALLRPVVQDRVLPVVATVAGPTERRYLAQMQCLYPWAGVVPSHVVQRPSVYPLTAADVRALEPCGGVESLRVQPQPMTAIGLAGLPPRARAWLLRCDELSAEIFATRRQIRSGLSPASTRLRSAWTELSATATAAMHGLRSAGAWPLHAAAVDGALHGTASAQDLGRAARRLFQVRRSLLRDGRRATPECVKAWRAVQRSAERRMSTLELCARWGPDTVHILSRAFAGLDVRGVELFGGEP